MPDQPRVCLVGESNPHGSDPRYALYPRPDNAAGGRLARILGLERPEYLRAFLRRNLLTGPKWSVPAARAAAATLLSELPPNDKLVLLGSRVSAAFGLDFGEYLWASGLMPVGGGRPQRAADACLKFQERFVLVLPHPSGRNLLWNDPAMALKACVLVDRFRQGTADVLPTRAASGQPAGAGT